MRVAGCGVEWKGELGSVDDRRDTSFQSARGRGKRLEHVHVGETERTRKDEQARDGARYADAEQGLACSVSTHCRPEVDVAQTR